MSFCDKITLFLKISWQYEMFKEMGLTELVLNSLH